MLSTEYRKIMFLGFFIVLGVDHEIKNGYIECLAVLLEKP